MRVRAAALHVHHVRLQQAGFVEAVAVSCVCAACHAWCVSRARMRACACVCARIVRAHARACVSEPIAGCMVPSRLPLLTSHKTKPSGFSFRVRVRIPDAFYNEYEIQNRMSLDPPKSRIPQHLKHKPSRLAPPRHPPAKSVAARPPARMRRPGGGNTRARTAVCFERASNQQHRVRTRCGVATQSRSTRCRGSEPPADPHIDLFCRCDRLWATPARAHLALRHIQLVVQAIALRANLKQVVVVPCAPKSAKE